MRCPKCGYTSFDHLDNCKKCGKDLLEFKERYGIRSVLFPGQMNTEDPVLAADLEAEEADAAVVAATGAAAAAVSESPAEESPTASDSDDFGFDFMDDSAEDDDLSFDELFEEAPEDEDVEETIEGPREQGADPAPAEEVDEDFAFDLPEEEDDLAEDFGFDPADMDDEGAEDPSEEEAGEDPKNPFDQPESSRPEAAPESQPASAGVAPARESMVGATADLFAGDPDPVVSEPAPAEAGAVPPQQSGKTAESPAPEPMVAAAGTVGSFAASRTDALAVEAEAGEADREAPPLAVAPRTVAGLASRIGAFVCDCAILILVGFCFVAVAEAAMSTGETRFLPSSETLIDLSVPYFLVLFFLAFGYFTLFHFLAGQTPGKMLAGLRVETLDGGPLLFGQAFLRSVGGLLQLLPAGLGYLAILASPERRGWNDRLAGTRLVVAADAAEPDEA